MSTTTKLPTFSQMKSRDVAHLATLRKLAEGRQLLRAGAYPSEVRGMRTLLATLARWGCVETVSTVDEATGRNTYSSELTERGRQYLDWADDSERMP